MSIKVGPVPNTTVHWTRTPYEHHCYLDIGLTTNAPLSTTSWNATLADIYFPIRLAGPISNRPYIPLFLHHPGHSTQVPPPDSTFNNVDTQSCFCGLRCPFVALDSASRGQTPHLQVRLYLPYTIETPVSHETTSSTSTPGERRHSRLLGYLPTHSLRGNHTILQFKSGRLSIHQPCAILHLRPPDTPSHQTFPDAHRRGFRRHA